MYTECLFFWTVELDSSSATDWEHYEMFKNGVNSGDLVAQFPVPVSVAVALISVDFHTQTKIHQYITIIVIVLVAHNFVQSCAKKQ